MGYIPYLPPVPSDGGGTPYVPPIGGGNGSPYNLPPITNNPPLSPSKQPADLTYQQLIDAYNATRAPGEKPYTPNSNQTDNALTGGIKDFGAWVIFLVFVLVFLYIIATGETPTNTLIKMGKNGTLIPVPV